MTTAFSGRGPQRVDGSELPPELVAERRRIQRLAADADRRADRGRLRRRALLPTAVASGVLVGSGLLSVWARSTTPASSSTAGQLPTAARTAAAQTSSEQAFLRQLRQALHADQQAIAGLPQVAASSLAASAGSTPAAGPSAAGGSSWTGTLAPISLPSISAPPAVHATTGASGIP